MFKFLFDFTSERVTRAAYYAIRLVKHRKEISDIHSGLVVDGLPSEPSLEDQELAAQIIREIQKTERVPLKKLDESKAEQYIQGLTNIVLEVARRSSGYDRESGEQLLNSLREVN